MKVQCVSPFTPFILHSFKHNRQLLTALKAKEKESVKLDVEKKKKKKAHGRVNQLMRHDEGVKSINRGLKKQVKSKASDLQKEKEELEQGHGRDG